MIVYIDCKLYDPFPNVKGETNMTDPDDNEEDPQDSENSDNDGTGRPDPKPLFVNLAED